MVEGITRAQGEPIHRKRLVREILARARLYKDANTPSELFANKMHLDMRKAGEPERAWSNPE